MLIERARDSRRLSREDYHTVNPLEFFKNVADDTRLRCILLLVARPELCVAEITCALGLSQPKTSRHLAQLRNSGLLHDRRRGHWVFYRLHPKLPGWALAVLQETAQANNVFIAENLARLSRMERRPSINRTRNYSRAI